MSFFDEIQHQKPHFVTSNKSLQQQAEDFSAVIKKAILREARTCPSTKPFAIRLFVKVNNTTDLFLSSTVLKTQNHFAEKRIKKEITECVLTDYAHSFHRELFKILQSDGIQVKDWVFQQGYYWGDDYHLIDKSSNIGDIYNDINPITPCPINPAIPFCKKYTTTLTGSSEIVYIQGKHKILQKDVGSLGFSVIYSDATAPKEASIISCPHCKSRIRIMIKSRKVRVTCPVCKQSFEVQT